MTKRRPSWSDRLRQAAALFCGLLWLHGSSTVWAASKRATAKPAAHKSAKPVKKAPQRAVGKRHRSPARPVPVGPEVGTAEVAERDVIGLHGSASFYGRGFQGRKTSTGERFDVKQFTAASNHFPLGTMVAVRRLDNDLCAIVKVNDRMAGHRRRIVDVSRGVAEYLDMIRAGVVLVRVAPIKAGGRGLSACHAAFEAEPPCNDCGRPPRLPDFSSEPE